MESGHFADFTHVVFLRASSADYRAKLKTIYDPEPESFAGNHTVLLAFIDQSNSGVGSNRYKLYFVMLI